MDRVSQMPTAGEQAPDFEVQADDGSTVRLSDYRGSKVVLYFYPRADTPGCTVQACEIRDNQERLDEAGAVVLGISPDPVESVRAFRAKYGLPFRLLADADHAIAEMYGVWGEKSMFGKKYMGASRTTFLIDENGRIARILENVKPESHVGLVLGELSTDDGG
jgi:thioredoxin-dependent peroxiredoxin